MTQQFASETYRGEPAEIYERYFVPAIGAPLAEELVQVANPRPGERVLDVACGTGVVARLASERVGDAPVAGVDVNPQMLAAARRADRSGTIEWHEASAEALPLGDGSFDLVLCQMGLQFFPDRPGALREMARVLDDGGRVVLNVPGPTPPLLAALEEALGRHAGPQAAGFVASVFSLHEEEELRGLLAGAGLRNAEARSARGTLALPPAEDFLWQYVYGTPLAAIAATLDADRRAALQRDVVEAWEPFVADDGLVLEVDVTTATARAA